MKIGVLKEIKPDENRVALTPHQVETLSLQKHEVYVESSAGVHSNYTDEFYQASGAIIASKQTLLNECELLLKIKCPLASEFKDYTQQHTLLTYLHFDENISPHHIQALTQSGFLGIAYEWVENKGRYPLLEPMSKITGYLYYQRAKELCTKHKGILCPRFDNLNNPGATILIIGIGTIGTQVLKSALTDNINIFIVDKHPDRVKNKITSMGFALPPHLQIIPFNTESPDSTRLELHKIMHRLDIVINCAVRRADLPKDTFDYLIDRSMIQKMVKNSVVCDATACDKDFIETCVSSEQLDSIEVIDGVVHYNTDHIPSLTGQSSTEKLTDATFPYISLMANEGIYSAIKNNEALQKGVSCFQGKLTHAYTAHKKGFEHYNILDLLP